MRMGKHKSSYLFDIAVCQGDKCVWQPGADRDVTRSLEVDN